VPVDFVNDVWLQSRFIVADDAVCTPYGDAHCHHLLERDIAHLFLCAEHVGSLQRVRTERKSIVRVAREMPSGTPFETVTLLGGGGANIRHSPGESVPWRRDASCRLSV
jgi:hypothetical protein